MRRLDGLAVLIVATLRTGEQHDDEQLLGELLLDPVTVAVQPAPLTEHATAGMVSARLGPTAALFTRACHRTTLGNPLLLRQLLRALQTEGVRPDAAHADTVMAVGSRAVSSMVLMRLRRMPPDVTVVARAVAVLGEGAQLPAVAAFTALTESRNAGALAALIRSGGALGAGRCGRAARPPCVVRWRRPAPAGPGPPAAPDGLRVRIRQRQCPDRSRTGCDTGLRSGCLDQGAPTRSRADVRDRHLPSDTAPGTARRLLVSLANSTGLSGDRRG